jgi:glutathione synthase/RimK-type ligase-like ATP-grasp enzyme
MTSDEPIKPTSKTLLVIVDGQDDLHVSNIESICQKVNKPLFIFDISHSALANTIITVNDNYFEINNGVSKIKSTQISGVILRSFFVAFGDKEKTLEEKLWADDWNQVVKGILSMLLYDGVKIVPSYPQSLVFENKLSFPSISKIGGFQYPNTLVSNHKSMIIRKVEHGKNVLKPFSQKKYIINQSEYGAKVIRMTQELLESMNEGDSPILLQDEIIKQFEVRVTTVGKISFACKIDNQKSDKASLDWRRYDFDNVPHTSMILPPEISSGIQKIHNKLRVNYSAIDFAVDVNDNWWFLDFNPSGQWLWIEKLTTMPITLSILEYLNDD